MPHGSPSFLVGAFPSASVLAAAPGARPKESVDEEGQWFIRGSVLVPNCPDGTLRSGRQSVWRRSDARPTPPPGMDCAAAAPWPARMKR